VRSQRRVPWIWRRITFTSGRCTMWALSAATITSAPVVRREMDDRKIPLMGFWGVHLCCSMINFTISGHRLQRAPGGGLILSILLGPYAAFLTDRPRYCDAGVLFCRGGLCIGCNIFISAFPAFIAYPPHLQKIVGSTPLNQISSHRWRPPSSAYRWERSGCR